MNGTITRAHDNVFGLRAMAARCRTHAESVAAGRGSKLLAGLSAAVVALSSVMHAQQLPDGPGKTELLKVCGACHQAERSASVRLTREGWEGVIGDMIQRGAKGSDEDFNAILEYLATHFLGDAPRPLNINRATNLDLESVAGLTRKEAAAVLAWLDQVGICKSLEELKKVPGLDYKKIDARKDFIVCFEAPPPPKKEK